MRASDGRNVRRCTFGKRLENCVLKDCGAEREGVTPEKHAANGFVMRNSLHFEACV